MKQAVILAAGEGYRLKPFTLNKPKAMLNVAGKPVISYVLEALADNGIRDIIIVVGYRKEQIFDYVGDGRAFGVEVRYRIQSNLIGGANALAQVKGMTDREFLVLSGNQLITAATIAPLIAQTATALLIKREKDPSRYGVVSVKDGEVLGIEEKPPYPKSNLINAGVYVFNDNVFTYTETELSLPDVVNKLLENGETVKAVETDQVWLDVVYPWDILRLNSNILQGIQACHNGVIESGVQLKGRVSVGKDTIIRSNTYIVGPVLIGKGCDIGPNACIFPSTCIGDNVVVSSFSQIKNSVIGDDVHFAAGISIEDTVVDNGCIIGSHFNACSEETEARIDLDHCGEEHHKVKTGAMLGAGCRIGNMVTATAGSIIGNYSQVSSLKMVSGSIPDRSLVI